MPVLANPITTEKVSISLPSEVLREIDELAINNSFNRSNMIVRIYKQWKAMRTAKTQKDAVLENDSEYSPAA